MIRVAFDIHAVGEQATGNETYAEGLLHQYLQAPAPDMDFRFYQTRPLAPGQNRARFRRLWPAQPWLRLPLATPWALWRDRVDVAHFQYFAPPWASCPAVLTVHDLSFERNPDYFPLSMATRMRTLMPGQVRRAAHVIAVSNATRDDLVELYGVASERVSVIHNGVGPGFVPPQPDGPRPAILERLDIRTPYILGVGNLGMRKNQRTLVRAFASLPAARQGRLQLVLVGKRTESASEVMDEIRQCGVAENIRLAGFVDTGDLVALYGHALFSVYLSFYEGFGLPILESMACGTPVLTSSLSCMPEVAGDAALLVQPDDTDAVVAALGRLAEDPALRQHLSQAGRIHAARYSWTEAARQTQAVYRQVHHENRAWRGG
ncbi:MAG: glycosyltransferase family 1 protein [Pseudomonadota bacterium]